MLSWILFRLDTVCSESVMLKIYFWKGLKSNRKENVGSVNMLKDKLLSAKLKS